METDVTTRAVACLYGLATGDAVGKQTENLSHADVQRWYPHGVRGFEAAPGSVIPRYRGNTKREWRVAETTDDTERTIAVARAILQDGTVAHTTVGRELLACEKCVHPGIKSLWEFHKAADPLRATDRHDGCGAAVRMAPVGILYQSTRFEEILAGAREAAISTHGGPLALAAAAATAMAIASAIDAEPADVIMRKAIAAAAEIERRVVGTQTFAEALRQKHEALARTPALDCRHLAREHFPTQTLTIVPLAIAVATRLESAEAAIILVSNIGGDSDSVGAIAGAILGARYPESVNCKWVAAIEHANHHDLQHLGERLAALRR